jgi:hypothetical protein
VLKEITLKYCAPDGSGIPKEFGFVPQMEHPIRLRNVHCAYAYHSLAAMFVDRKREAAKTNAKPTDLTSLRVMGDAIVKIWVGNTPDEFVWKEV